MFERFDAGARRALFFSKFHAAAMGEPQIGPEHLLAGLLRENDKPTVEVLQALRVDIQRLREECQANFVLPPSASTDPGLSIISRRIVAAAANAADELGANVVASSCLLLAIMREPENSASKLLAAQGVTYQELVKHLRNRVDL